MINIIIIVAGGFAGEVYVWTKAAFINNKKYHIKGFLSNNSRDLEGFGIGLPILGDPKNYNVNKQDHFIVAIGTVSLKKELVSSLRERGAKFLTLVHPTAIVASSAIIGEGVVLCPFTIVSDHVKLGNFVIINLYASCGHDVKMGDFSFLSPYATINGWSVLEEEVFIASHVTVVTKRIIGMKARVSANTAVMKNVGANELVEYRS